MTQTTKAKKLNLSQSTISNAKKRIKSGDIFVKSCQRVLEEEGKGELIDTFIKAVQG